MEKFFITCPINFEKLCAKEICLKWPKYFSEETPHLTFVTGGIEIECKLENGLALNHILKIPSRILLRLKEQKCRDIPKLFNIIRKFNWKKYLKKEKVNWQITTHKSRLINTKKIETACEDGLQRYFQANALAQKVKDSPGPIQNIFLRITNDDLTLSIDTSGNLLHIRGDRTFRGHASIRENIAAALLLYLLEETRLDQTRLGKNNSEEISIDKISLLDPMCGTGTFLSETLSFFKPSQREFAYFDWFPSFCIETINIDNKSASDKDKKDQYEWNFNLYGCDIDKKILNNIQVQNQAQFEKVDFQQRDVFEEIIPAQRKPVDYIICNPPYGKRIKLNQKPKTYFKNLISSLLKNYFPKKAGVLIPVNASLNYESLLNDFPEYHIETCLPFSNNGIKIHFIVISQQVSKD